MLGASVGAEAPAAVLSSPMTDRKGASLASPEIAQRLVAASEMAEGKRSITTFGDDELRLRAKASTALFWASVEVR
jgi:hypothetical protein